ncbi:MAG: VOC family protein [Phycisphaeraceae bacterium]|nr:VOC family protein [Phycisphaeraceae bacterium]
MSAQHASHFADKIEMQNRLFAELSGMFGREVPLYDKSLAVNSICNRAVCDLVSRLHRGFAVSDEQLERTSGERHGAIRIGRPDEYRWIGRFFACFAMEPHNFYDTTIVGAKSQPVIATAFRSVVHPEHRVFTSLLQTDYFDADTRARIEALLAKRQVFSDKAKQLIEKSERQGGLDRSDAEALIREGSERIFKWTGRAFDHALYTHLCDAGFKIAADIACFQAHHLNHLTPNTFCMDLYTSAMKFCLGEIPEPTFRRRAASALDQLESACDRDWIRLHFKHLTRDRIASFAQGSAGEACIASIVDAIVERLNRPDLQLSKLNHAGYKDCTEGPPADTPVLLRQDAYKALSEPVHFVNPDGSELDTVHTARFGEIEQRFYATTPKGRALYDRCLDAAEAQKESDPGLIKRDFEAYQAAYAAHFAPFPKTLPELVANGLVYATFEPTHKGLAARGTIQTTDVLSLLQDGFVDCQGLRYEDFLPVSAAGIFASNLNQYGTKSTAPVKPTYTRSMLEDILGKPIVDSDAVYRGLQADSILHTLSELDLVHRLASNERARMELEASACPRHARHNGSRPGVLATRA